MRLVVLAMLAAASPVATACWEQAARAYGVDPWLLYGIAVVESGQNPSAINASHWHRTGSYDLGLMQINSRNFPALTRDGITPEMLWDPCTNIFAGARILREKIDRYGNTWEAVGAYNAACTTLKGQACRQARSRYAWKVYRAMQRAMTKHGIE